MWQTLLTVVSSSLGVSQPSAQNKKYLVEAAAALEKSVLLPMGELSQSTLFHFDVLRETLQSQTLVLEGPSAAPLGVPSSSGGPRQLSSGLTKLIAQLTEDHDQLVARVARITERLATQKQTAELQLSLALTQRSKVIF